MPSGIYDRKPGKGARWIMAHLIYSSDECLPWPYSKLNDGYGSLGYQGGHWRAHVLMCTLAHGPAPSPDHEAAHSCGNGHLGCCNQIHLGWKTRSENQRDRYKKERLPRKGLPRYRLTADDVREIRRLRGVVTQQSLADRFGVSRPHIIMVQKGQTYAYVSEIK